MEDTVRRGSDMAFENQEFSPASISEGIFCRVGRKVVEFTRTIKETFWLEVLRVRIHFRIMQDAPGMSMIGQTILYIRIKIVYSPCISYNQRPSWEEVAIVDIVCLKLMG